MLKENNPHPFKEIALPEGVQAENLIAFLSKKLDTYYFENKEGQSFIGIQANEKLDPNHSPFCFFKANFEDHLPKFFTCNLLLFQEGTNLKAYMSEDFDSSLLEASTLKNEFNQEELIIDQEGEFPDFENWKKNVEKAVEKIKAENSLLTKVVLARKLKYYYSQDVSAENLFLKTKDQFSNVFKIFISTPENSFISFTPERIFCFRKETLSLEAIAGTRGRDNDAKKDRLLELELLSDPKEISEHEFVVAAITEAFKNENFEKSERHILKLRGLQHIKTKIQVKKPQPLNTEDISNIILNLHPTPAVGGTPKRDALDFIKSIEGERGLYAGVFGIKQGDQMVDGATIKDNRYCEAAVLIRSFEIKGRELTAYAGAGIVKESIAENEWVETRSKLESFLGIFKS